MIVAACSPTDAYDIPLKPSTYRNFGPRAQPDLLASRKRKMAVDPREPAGVPSGTSDVKDSK